MIASDTIIWVSQYPMGILNRNGIQRMGEIFNISRRKGAKLGPLFKNFHQPEYPDL